MSPDKASRPPSDFYEIQKRQSRRSLAVFALLLLFSALALGTMILVVWTCVAAAAGRLPFAEPGFWARFGIVVTGASLFAAGGLVYDARRFGGAFILKRLGAAPPDPSDRYHKAFQDAVDGLRLAAGLPRARAAVLPDWTVNSLAVVEPDGTPVVAVTEGLLAELTRDEVEAAVAHEIAHVARGDAFILTLVCGAANAFERLRDALEPGDALPPGAPGARARGGGLPLAALAGLSAFVVRGLGILVGRRRELLADAAAVELGRSPAALGRALHKARVSASFVGDFNRTYAPLFIVEPAPRGEASAERRRRGSTHPPVGRRIRVLAEMARKTPVELLAEVRDQEAARERARLRFPSFEEMGGKPPAGGAALPGGEASGLGRCPRCREPLSDQLYEGVPIRVCKSCLGKLVPREEMDRILARREIGFSLDLRRKAEAFRAAAAINPLKKMKAADRRSPPPGCPECGYRLASRPYSYQHFLPVERCLDCGRIWFDADELEILQILVENARDPS